jgi:hypothetical protein
MTSIRQSRPPAVKVECHRCSRQVPPVDREYARHYRSGILCLGSKREIVVRKDRDASR